MLPAAQTHRIKTLRKCGQIQNLLMHPCLTIAQIPLRNADTKHIIDFHTGFTGCTDSKCDIGPLPCRIRIQPHTQRRICIVLIKAGNTVAI